MSNYGAQSITSLDGLEAVRKRPAMYIGSTAQQGLNQLVWEIYDNCVDEFCAGYGKEIDVTVNEDCSIEIQDRGRGMPVGISNILDSKGNPMNVLTAALTKLHTGGKFNDDNNDGYIKTPTGGTYGIGAKATNALSSKFIVKVKRDGKIYKQEFSKGEPITDVEEIGTCDKDDTGTYTYYLPDNTIFKQTLEPSCKNIQNKLNESASLNAGLKINYINKITNFEKTYYRENGIADLLMDSVNKEKLLFEQPNITSYLYTGEKNVKVDIAFIYEDLDEPMERIKTFCNNINTFEGGFHLNGFRNGLKNELNKHGIACKLIQQNIEMRYILDGINAIISIKIPEPELEGQTKTKLGSIEAQYAVEEALNKFFEENKKTLKPIFDTIVQKAVKCKEAEEAARKARALSRKAGKTMKMALPGKLSDCSNKSGYSELFLCLDGETKVKLLNGTTPTIKELTDNYKEPFWVYSMDENGKPYPAKAVNPRITQYVDKLLKLTLSDGSIIKCTPEHRFMKKETMEWVEAKDIEVNSSLYGFSFKIFDNYNLAHDKGYMIINIEELTYKEKIPVYCLTVESDTHAFTLANGLITHNCEGDSAAGSMKAGRFKEFQAVLPLRGKVLNTEKSSLDKMLQSDAIKNIIAALGCGIGKNFDISKCRYDKMIIACDADVDGAHIQALILTLVYNYMRPLLDNGYVYIAQPPLYKVVKGKESQYLKDDYELKEYKKKNKGNIDVQRFKGLTHCLAPIHFSINQWGMIKNHANGTSLSI